MIQQAGTVLIIVSAVLADACVVAYHLRARWWESPYGRHLFSFMAVFGLCLSLWAMRLFIPEGDWFEYARLIAFAGVPVVLGWRLWMILTTQRDERRRRMREERP